MGGLRYVTAGVDARADPRARRAGRCRRARLGHGSRVLGFFMLLLGNGGVVWGEQFVPSGLTAVLIGTSPFWMVGDRRDVHARASRCTLASGSACWSGFAASSCWSGRTSRPAASAAAASSAASSRCRSPAPAGRSARPTPGGTSCRATCSARRRCRCSSAASSCWRPARSLGEWPRLSLHADGRRCRSSTRRSSVGRRVRGLLLRAALSRRRDRLALHLRQSGHRRRARHAAARRAVPHADARLGRRDHRRRHRDRRAGRR